MCIGRVCPGLFVLGGMGGAPQGASALDEVDQKTFIEQGFPQWGDPPTTTTRKLASSPMSPHCIFCPKNVDFVIVMQFLAILLKLPPIGRRAKFQRTIPEKAKHGGEGGRGVDDLESPGVLKKSMLKFQGVIKKKSRGISMGLDYWSWNFQGVQVTQFCGICRSESLFSLEFPRLR